MSPEELIAKYILSKDVTPAIHDDAISALAELGILRRDIATIRKAIIDEVYKALEDNEAAWLAYDPSSNERPSYLAAYDVMNGLRNSTDNELT